MNNKSIIVLIFIIIHCSCSPTRKLSNFFREYEFSSIASVPKGTEYKKDYIDYHFPELGTFSYPASVYLKPIKYDTLSRFVVLFSGFVYFEGNDSLCCPNVIKKIKLEKMKIVRAGRKNSRNYEFSNEKKLTRTDSLTIPYRILNKLRKNFLFVNRNTIYSINSKSLRDSFPISTPYKLY